MAPIDDTTSPAYRLAERAAEVWGYRRRLPNDEERRRGIVVVWDGPVSGKLKKGQRQPMIVCSSQHVECVFLDSSVSLYLHEDALDTRPVVDGCTIRGWNIEDLGRVEDYLQFHAPLDVAPQLLELFTARLQFLASNPGYRIYPKKSAQKKVYASQIEV